MPVYLQIFVKNRTMPVAKGKTNNPLGRIKGSKNIVQYDIKKRLSEKMDEGYIEGIFDDIQAVDDPNNRAKLKIKLCEFFVPKPRDIEDVNKENEFRDELMRRLFDKGE